MGMHQQWTVVCDADAQATGGSVCCASDQVSGSKSQAAASFKRSGWVYKRKRGWFCPDCVIDGKTAEFHKPNQDQ